MPPKLGGFSTGHTRVTLEIMAKVDIGDMSRDWKDSEALLLDDGYTPPGLNQKHFMNLLSHGSNKAEFYPPIGRVRKQVSPRRPRNEINGAGPQREFSTCQAALPTLKLVQMSGVGGAEG